MKVKISKDFTYDTEIMGIKLNSASQVKLIFSFVCMRMRIRKLTFFYLMSLKFIQNISLKVRFQQYFIKIHFNR